MSLILPAHEPAFDFKDTVMQRIYLDHNARPHGHPDHSGHSLPLTMLSYDLKGDSWAIFNANLTGNF